MREDGVSGGRTAASCRESGRPPEKARNVQPPRRGGPITVMSTLARRHGMTYFWQKTAGSIRKFFGRPDPGAESPEAGGNGLAVLDAPQGETDFANAGDGEFIAEAGRWEAAV